jgi:ABC-type multidrug transport system permease subunit
MKEPHRLQTSLRIIWAIALKDVVDAIKNKTILSALGSVVFTLVMYKYLPYLSGGDELPNLLLFDAGNSALAAQLEGSPHFKLLTYDSQEHMLRALTRADYLELGLVFPAGLDERLQKGETVALDGYAAYWIQEERVQGLRQTVEDEIAFLAKRPVTIEVNGHKLYPQDPDEAGSGFMVSIAAVLVLTMIGVLIVVHLMLEEKQAKTIDALLVAPITPLHMLLGKAVTGMVYCLAGIAAVFALNPAYITNWGLALGGAFCGALFTVGLGLCLGTFFESRQQLTLWGFVLMSVLLLPAFLAIEPDLLPAAAIGIARWVPTSAIAWLVRASFPPHVPAGQTLLHLGYVLAWAVAAYALAAWRMNKLER